MVNTRQDPVVEAAKMNGNLFHSRKGTGSPRSTLKGTSSRTINKSKVAARVDCWRREPLRSLRSKSRMDREQPLVRSTRKKCVPGPGPGLQVPEVRVEKAPGGGGGRQLLLSVARSKAITPQSGRKLTPVRVTLVPRASSIKRSLSKSRGAFRVVTRDRCGVQGMVQAWEQLANKRKRLALDSCSPHLAAHLHHRVQQPTPLLRLNNYDTSAVTNANKKEEVAACESEVDVKEEVVMEVEGDAEVKGDAEVDVEDDGDVFEPPAEISQDPTETVVAQPAVAVDHPTAVTTHPSVGNIMVRDDTDVTQFHSLLENTFAEDTTQYLSALDTTRLSGLDNTRLSGLDNTRLSGLDNTRLSGLDNIRLSGLDNIRLSGLDNTRLSVSSTQLDDTLQDKTQWCSVMQDSVYYECSPAPLPPVNKRTRLSSSSAVNTSIGLGSLSSLKSASSAVNSSFGLRSSPSLTRIKLNENTITENEELRKQNWELRRELEELRRENEKLRIMKEERVNKEFEMMANEVNSSGMNVTRDFESLVRSLNPSLSESTSQLRASHPQLRESQSQIRTSNSHIDSSTHQLPDSTSPCTIASTSTSTSTSDVQDPEKTAHSTRSERCSIS